MNDDEWLIGLRGKLANHGLIVARDKTVHGSTGAFLVRGQTLQLEPALAAVGGVWDRACAAWRIASLRQLLTLVAQLEHEVVYTFPTQEAELQGLAEESAIPGEKSENLTKPSLDKRILRLARLPTDILEPDEIIEIMVALGTSIKEPQQITKELMNRFNTLGAMLAAEPYRYKECLFTNKCCSSSFNMQSELRYEYWELSTLFKTVRELMQRILKEKIEDRPVIGSWLALIEYIQIAMQHETTEHFRILFLDRKNILVRDEVQSRGTVDHTPLYPREVVKRALELAASAIIMVHNHPSGDPTPSGADVKMTKQVVAALGQVGIAVHDHIIVGKNRHTSFRDAKLL